MTPTRIQRKRTKGWRMPPNTVIVDRSTKWGNPYINPDFRAQAVIYFLADLENYGGYRLPRKKRVDKEAIRAELRGKNLACWCPLDEPCHADVLLKIANG